MYCRRHPFVIHKKTKGKRKLEILAKLVFVVVVWGDVCEIHGDIHNK